MSQDLGGLFQAITDAAQSHAGASGWFDQVNGHEPKSAPGNGLTAAVWVDQVTPYPGGSGLAATTIVVVLNVRVYASFVMKPEDAIDPNLIAAVGALMAAYSADFELGGIIQAVDLLGRTGQPLAARAGYLNQDGRLYRVMTITVPCICNDTFDQAP